MSSDRDFLLSRRALLKGAVGAAALATLPFGLTEADLKPAVSGERFRLEPGDFLVVKARVGHQPGDPPRASTGQIEGYAFLDEDGRPDDRPLFAFEFEDVIEFLVEGVYGVELRAGPQVVFATCQVDGFAYFQARAQAGWTPGAPRAGWLRHKGGRRG